MLFSGGNGLELDGEVEDNARSPDDSGNAPPTGSPDDSGNAPPTGSPDDSGKFPANLE